MDVRRGYTVIMGLYIHKLDATITMEKTKGRPSLCGAQCILPMRISAVIGKVWKEQQTMIGSLFSNAQFSRTGNMGRPPYTIDRILSSALMMSCIFTITSGTKMQHLEESVVIIFQLLLGCLYV